MSLKIQVKLHTENQPASAQLFSTSPEKERRGRIRRVRENTLPPESSIVQGRRSSGVSTSSHLQPSTTPSEQQLVAAASEIFDQAKESFDQLGPNEDSITLCNNGLKIPFTDSGLRWKGLFLLALFHEKRARSEAAEEGDLDCAIVTQETLLKTEYDCSPIEKAKLQYMLARNVLRKALQEHDLNGVDRTISIIQGILTQDCLNAYQRIGLERNLAKAINARSLFEPQDSEQEFYLG